MISDEDYQRLTDPGRNRLDEISRYAVAINALLITKGVYTTEEFNEMLAQVTSKTDQLQAELMERYVRENPGLTLLGKLIGDRLGF